jgi:hypothetical protein
MPALPFHMVARVSAQISKLLPRLAVAIVRTNRFASAAIVESCRIRQSRYIAFTPTYSQSRANAAMESLITTPLFLITSIQPPHFHAIAHSFAQRRTAISHAFNCLHTLSIATGVYPLRSPCLRCVRSVVRFFPPSSAQARQLFCLHRLGASLSSLCALFRTRFLCFQSLAASFPETPGVGVSVKSPGSSIATWTRRAHPIIIAASARFQVHG